MTEKIVHAKKRSYGMVSLSRDEIHDQVIELIDWEPRGNALDVPAGTGVLADRLRKIGLEVFCCDIDPTYFSAPDLNLDIGDLNQSLPYPSASFDLITCIEGMEHLENPIHAIREYFRILKPGGGRLILSLPNYLNIERRLRFLITGVISKIPSPKKLGRDRFEHLYMLHLTR